MAISRVCTPLRWRQFRHGICQLTVAVLFLNACGDPAQEEVGQRSDHAAMSGPEALDICEELASSKSAAVAAWGATTAGEIVDEWTALGLPTDPWSSVPRSTPVADCAIGFLPETPPTSSRCQDGRLYVDVTEQFYRDRSGLTSIDRSDSARPNAC